jgi:hypothetical protein
VRDLVRYLKNKPTGATVAEARATVKKQVLDPRKMTAYTLWGFINKDGERMKLTTRGWDYARKPETETDVFRRAIDSVVPYKSVLEWAYHQKVDSISNVDVAAHWHEHHGTALGTDNEDTIKNNAVCFFHLCEAAGLGKLVIGRKGQATRLSLDRDQLAKYIEAGPSTPPWVGGTDETASEAALSANEVEEAEEGRLTTATPTPTPTPVPTPARLTDVKVFISHGSNMDIVEQVQTMLGIADIPSEVAVKEETSAIPVPEKIFGAMRRCQAGIIIVSVDETRTNGAGQYSINENVLIEIGAAFVLYEKRVVLVWDKRLTVPSNLQGLYRCEFEGNELSWSAGMKLMKAIRGFKSQEPA